MTNAELHTNNMISINGKIYGQVKAVTASGQVQNATASKPQIKAQFRPFLAPSTLGDPITMDLPVYISTSPSDHHLNPALIDAIQGMS